MQISLDQISKKYRDCTALRDISLSIDKGELIAIIGPSGSGKTTLLKVIAGLEQPTQGHIFIDGTNATLCSPNERNIGFVFQHYALFKHMTVLENIAFGLKMKDRKDRLSNEKINKKVEELIHLVKIGNLQNRYPHELSGGQRQRVALARALAVEPQILLLDEPFAALDAKLKLELRRWLRKLQKQTKITIILVTHDQEEALDIADRVLIMRHGNMEQIGTSEEIYHNPCNPFVYNFLGHYNVFKAIKSAKGELAILNKAVSKEFKKEKWYHRHKIVSGIASIFSTNKLDHNQQNEEYFEIFVRPHDIEISKKHKNNEYVEAVITHLNLAAPLVKMELESSEYELIQAEVSHEIFEKLEVKIGDLVYIKARQFTMFT